MKKFFIVTFFFVACSPIVKEQTVLPPHANTIPPVISEDEQIDVTYLGPHTIIRILNNSKRLYNFQMDTAISGFDLRPLPAKRLLHPRLELIQTDPIQLGIKQLPPSVEKSINHIYELLNSDQSQQALKTIDKLLNTYNAIATLHYLKGQCLFKLKDYTQSLAALNQAISINQTDWLSYLLLSKIYDLTGNYPQAFENSIKAFALNQHDPLVLKQINQLLDENGLMIDNTRFFIPAKIEQRDANNVDLVFKNEQSQNFIPLVSCIACWQFEEACNHRPELDSKEQLEQLMYRECLANQALMFQKLTEEQKHLPFHQKALAQAVLKGYLPAIISWEFYARKHPEVMLLLSQQQREHIYDYIKGFVIKSKS